MFVIIFWNCTGMHTGVRLGLLRLPQRLMHGPGHSHKRKIHSIIE